MEDSPSRSSRCCKVYLKALHDRDRGAGLARTDGRVAARFGLRSRRAWTARVTAHPASDSERLAQCHRQRLRQKAPPPRTLISSITVDTTSVPGAWRAPAYPRPHHHADDKRVDAARPVALATLPKSKHQRLHRPSSMTTQAPQVDVAPLDAPRFADRRALADRPRRLAHQHHAAAAGDRPDHRRHGTTMVIWLDAGGRRSSRGHYNGRTVAPGGCASPRKKMCATTPRPPPQESPP